MSTSKILVQKINMEATDFDTVLTFHKKVKETLPANIKAVVVPHTWEFKQVRDKVIYIGMDNFTSMQIATSIINEVSDSLGEGYTILTNLCKVEVIDERY